MISKPFESNFFWIVYCLFFWHYDFFFGGTNIGISLQPSNNGVQNGNNVLNACYRRRLVIIRNSFIEYLIYKTRIFICSNSIIKQINYFYNKRAKAGIVLWVNMVMVDHVRTCWWCKPSHYSAKFIAVSLKLLQNIFSCHSLT